MPSEAQLEKEVLACRENDRKRLREWEEEEGLGEDPGAPDEDEDDDKSPRNLDELRAKYSPPWGNEFEPFYVHEKRMDWLDKAALEWRPPFPVLDLMEEDVLGLADPWHPKYKDSDKMVPVDCDVIYRAGTSIKPRDRGDPRKMPEVLNQQLKDDPERGRSCQRAAEVLLAARVAQLTDPSTGAKALSVAQLKELLAKQERLGDQALLQRNQAQATATKKAEEEEDEPAPWEVQ